MSLCSVKKKRSMAVSLYVYSSSKFKQLFRAIHRCSRLCTTLISTKYLQVGDFIHRSTSVQHAVGLIGTLHRVEDTCETCLMSVQITSVVSITYEQFRFRSYLTDATTWQSLGLVQHVKW